MSTHTDINQSYTIMEAAKLSGLPESTLRYYETIGLIDAIARDPSSKHRAYSEDNITRLVAVACLSATGMSIEDMRTYLGNSTKGIYMADKQISLLQQQGERLVEESRSLALRQKYIASKIDYWNAVELGDKAGIEAAKQVADTVAAELKLSRKG